MWERRGFQVGDVVPGPDGQRVRITRVIAEGGFSVVYEGRLEPSGVLCAIKALRLKHAGNRKTAERLLREGRALYALRHPNVVPVTYIGMRTEDELIYLVMKLLRGRNLRELQQDLTASQRDSGDKRPKPHARLPISWVLEIAIPICSALDAIHNKALAVHRDLKPENTFVEDDGSVSLFDVGSAKFPKETRLTTNDMTIGTVQYMSPEQLFRPADVDSRSDLFAFGVILYELLSGVLPFAPAPGESNDAQAQGHRIIFQPHRPLKESAPHVPDYLVEIVERLLRKKAEERYSSAARVRELLAAAHARFVTGLGDLAPLPLAQAVAAVPRTSPEASAEPAPLPSLPTSTNPFVTISLVPEVPAEETVAEPPTTAELPASGTLPTAESEAIAASAGEGSAVYVFVPPPASNAGASPTARPQDVVRGDAAQAWESSQRVAALRRQLAELPEELRRVFVLNQVHEMSVEEIAETIGVSAGIVRERVLEARARLDARLKEEREGARSLGESESLASHVREVQPSAAPERARAVTAPRAPKARGFVIALGLLSMVALTSYGMVRLRRAELPARDAGLSASASAEPTMAPPSPAEPAEAPPSPPEALPASAAAPVLPSPPPRPSSAPKPPAPGKAKPTAVPVPVVARPAPAPPPTAKNRLFNAEN